MRLSIAAALVLQAVADGRQYGFDIVDATGYPTGTVYPALRRLERDGLVRSEWEDARTARRDARPPRRYYELTRDGRRALAEAAERLRPLAALRPRSVR